MKPGCPNSSCTFYHNNNFVIKKGQFKRKEDSRFINRFQCKKCKKSFSYSTFKLEYRQKKRRINHLLFKLLASGISMRRSAKILNVHYMTVQRKLVYLAKKSKIKNDEFHQFLLGSKVSHLQFDDLITSIHTKLKPVSISVAVDANRRFILGSKVAEIPAFGLIAEISKKKYGKRKNEHPQKLTELFSTIQNVVEKEAQICSDEHYRYLPLIQEYFPHARYSQYKGERGSVVGQGELKKIKYDPLFKINHTMAMIRANMNRLMRRTWCTTKKISMLENHLEIYINYHNNFLLKNNK